MSDLVLRLREPRKWITAGHKAVDLCDEAALRIEQLELTLRSVRTILQSDSVEYDDMRHIDQMIDESLADSAPKTKGDDSGK